MASLKPQAQKIDRLLLFLVIGLTLFGVLMVYDASIITALRDFGDKYFYFRQQAIWAVLGLTALIFFANFKYTRLAKLAPVLMLGTILFLVLVFVPGIGIKVMGARRWVGFGKFNFQPAEFAKLSFILYLSSLFAQKRKLWPFLSISALLVALIMLEPDLGTTVILFASGFVIYFASGASLVSLLPIGAVSFLAGIALILSSHYRKERFLTFLDVSRDPLSSSYHIRQILLALGSGGIFGVGLGASRQKYEYLPESMTDSIFAIIAEEMGFVGAAVLIAVFFLIIWRGFKIAKEAPDNFGQLLAVGITALVGIQFLVNLSSMVALVPLTGVPLPLISYGGSSLIVTLSGLGILLNISKYRVKKK